MTPDEASGRRRSREHALASLARYWGQASAELARLPVPEAAGWEAPDEPRPVLVDIPLPDWALDAAVGGSLLVPAAAVAEGSAPAWRRVDWWRAVFLLLEGAYETAWERRHGPIHSYSFRLKGWEERLWSRAWVNRIALFLRRWCAREMAQEERAVFGPVPAPEILLTHDVDAVRKTAQIRIKQSAFHAFNAARALLRAKPGSAAERAARGFRFLFSREDYWRFDEVLAAEEASGLRSHFNFYAAGGTGRWLFDPAYDIADPRVRRLLERLVSEGWTVGLHQGFDSWRDAERMRAERERLERAAGCAVTSCRQHWLRFSWQDTWAAQAAAGLKLDTTLAFNDRPGFRNSAALRWHPWDERAQAPRSLQALPTLFMDSHFYDYQPMSDDERPGALEDWLAEVRLVGGQVAVLWHPHATATDYGWGQGFHELVALLRG